MSGQLKDKALRLFNAAKSKHERGLFEESLKNYLISLDIQEKLAKSDPFFNTWIATTLNNLGNLLSAMGKPDEALNMYERALIMREALLEGDRRNVVYQSDVAFSLNNQGNLLSAMGKPDEAKNSFERAKEMYEELLEGERGNAVYQSYVAGTINNLGNLLSANGKPEEALDMYERAKEMYETLLEGDRKNAAYQSYVAGTLYNLGNLLNDMGKPDEAKNSFERALIMREALLEGDRRNVVYQSDVAGTLNNLGVQLGDMGKPEEALNMYERALIMCEALLEGDRGNAVYQSHVAMTLNNLGLLMGQKGNFPVAKKYYEDSLGILKEPLLNMAIKSKSRTIINLIELISKEADRETNLSTKQNYFENVYAVYNQHKAFFVKHELVHENQLARESGLSAHIQYLMLNAKNETDTDKRIEEYEKCIKEVKKIAENEDDENLKKLWSSVMHYLEGRQMVNRAIKSSPPEKDMIKQAIERFKLAKDIYKHANVCYCIYTVLLELERIEVFDDKAVAGMKRLILEAIENLPEALDISVKAAFKEIELLLDKKNVKDDIEIFLKLNRCITKIDYYALREHFNYIYQNIASYLKESFSPNVSYRNWTLSFTFDEPEKVQGKLTIKTGDSILFDEPLGKRHKIYIEKYRPQMKEETITFIAEKGKNVTRHLNYSEEIKCDDCRIDVYMLEHNCRRSSTSGYFNIAIVQLKYNLYKKGNAIKINYDGAYLNKVTSIIDEVKGKADLIVFPEFSIPFDYLTFLKQYSDSNGVVIIAGSHYVTDENLNKYGGLFDSEFGEKDLLKNISPIIIPSSKIMHTEKIIGAKEERPLFFEEGMKHGTLNRIFKLRDNVTCGIMICFDFLNDELRERITDACNIIVVPQSNPGTERFHSAGKIEIDNKRGAGNTAYIMASGIFTFNGEKEIMGGDSGVILTLDKESHKKQDDAIIPAIDDVKEQFILMASLNMNFNASRDTQLGQIPMRSELIHIFEENEIINSKKDNPQSFIDLFEKIDSCGDRVKLKQLLNKYQSIIEIYSPLMNRHIKNLENLSVEQIKKRCHAIVIK